MCDERKILTKEECDRLFDELSDRDYDSLSSEEKSLLLQLEVEYDAECGYDYYEDE